MAATKIPASAKRSKATPAVTLPALQKKFEATEQSLNTRLVERAEFTRILTLGVIGRLNVFALGEPGVAKTAGVTMFRDHIADFPEDGYFWRLLTAFSEPNELFGPPDIAAMDEGKWRHQTENTMVPARLVLLDEIFKANSAILNSLLTYLNEGIFHNDVPIEVPRWCVIGLSNETPKGAELNAMFDRLELRMVVKRISSSSGFVQMLRQQHVGPVTPTLTVADIETAQAEVNEILIPDEVFDAMLTLRQELGRDGVKPTDRRFAKSLQVIKASTWLRGGTVAEVEDMRDLRHSLWDAQDERGTVDSHVLRLASPLDAKAMELRDQVDILSEDYERIFRDSDNDTQKNRNAIDLHVKLDRATDELVTLQSELTPGRRSEIMDELATRLDYMNDTILREVFGLDPNAKKN